MVVLQHVVWYLAEYLELCVYVLSFMFVYIKGGSHQRAAVSLHMCMHVQDCTLPFCMLSFHDTEI